MKEVVDSAAAGAEDIKDRATVQTLVLGASSLDMHPHENVQNLCKMGR